MSTKVWMDVDTGCDDAMALILAGHNPSIELLGISTIFGNNTLDVTTYNTKSVCDLAGFENIKIYPGASKPLMRTLDVSPG